MPAPEPEPDEERPLARARRAAKRAGAALAQLERNPRLVVAAKSAREALPGDAQFGDPLSTAGEENPHVAGRRLAALTRKRPGVLREVGLSALQIWQSVSEAQGRGRGDREVTIVFTDLVSFSSWALEAGDDAAVELLRAVAEAIEPPVRRHDGEVVKRLGDGMMAVFASPAQGLAAVQEACARLADVEAPGYRPALRAGLHSGRARKLGGDWFGMDVNIAARLGGEASGGEVLVSERALADLDTEALRARRKRFFRVKGVPRDITPFSIALGG